MSQHIDPPMNQASIVDNLTTDDGTKALSAAQGKALNDKLEHIDTTNTVTNLSNIPLNSQGRIKLGGSVSPSGNDMFVNYMCVGSSERTTLIIATINETYRNGFNGTSWVGWQEIALNSKSFTNNYKAGTGLSTLNDTSLIGYYTAVKGVTGAPNSTSYFEYSLQGRMQFATLISNGATKKVFVRVYENNAWNTWAELVTAESKIVFVSATATIGTISANSYASANVDVEFPEGTYGIKTIVPRYTSVGFPIAGAYGISGAPSGKQRITVGVYNFTSSAISNVTATIDVGFMY